MTAIRFSNVGKRYPNGHEALTGLNFALESGELAFLTGHSGAGKSTLLKLIMLMERPSRGEVWVGEQDLARLPRKQIPFHRRQIGVVFQNHQLLFDRSVFDNVALPLQISGYDPVDAARRVRAALDKVGLLAREKLNPITLSSGEQQRIGIAGPSCTSRSCCWPTNPPATWTRRCRRTSCICLNSLIGSVPRC